MITTQQSLTLIILIIISNISYSQISFTESGQLNFQYQGKLGPVCSVGFDLKDALVVCQITETILESYNIGQYCENGYDDFTISDLQCQGEEFQLDSCYHQSSIPSHKCSFYDCINMTFKDCRDAENADECSQCYNVQNYTPEQYDWFVKEVPLDPLQQQIQQRIEDNIKNKVDDQLYQRLEGKFGRIRKGQQVYQGNGNEVIEAGFCRKQICTRESGREIYYLYMDLGIAWKPNKQKFQITARLLGHDLTEGCYEKKTLNWKTNTEPTNVFYGSENNTYFDLFLTELDEFCDLSPLVDDIGIRYICSYQHSLIFIGKVIATYTEHFHITYAGEITASTVPQGNAISGLSDRSLSHAIQDHQAPTITLFPFTDITFTFHRLNSYYTETVDQIFLEMKLLNTRIEEFYHLVLINIEVTYADNTIGNVVPLSATSAVGTGLRLSISTTGLVGIKQLFITAECRFSGRRILAITSDPVGQKSMYLEVDEQKEKDEEGDSHHSNCSESQQNQFTIPFYIVIGALFSVLVFVVIFSIKKFKSNLSNSEMEIAEKNQTEKEECEKQVQQTS